jgi:nucleotide-binding universal stress UspA family protein
MYAKKILFPTDFSETSQAAFEHAVNLARDTGAVLVIVHVEEPPMPYGEAIISLPERFDEELKRRLEEVHESTIPCEHHLLVGDPASEIVRLAEALNVDLIVMGTHGRTGLSRLLMGSVAEAVVRRAPCAVYTVKHHELAHQHELAMAH